jgi:hypothetical protein
MPKVSFKRNKYHGTKFADKSSLPIFQIAKITNCCEIMKRTNSVWIYPLLIMALMLLLNTGCKNTDNQKKENNTTSQTSNPLPSWNETEHKKAIISFVEKVTTKGSPDFVPIAERIATFDNDGTLWPEKPMYFQMVFTFDRIKAMAPNHPEWKNKQPFKAVLENDYKTVFESGLESIDNLVMTVSADYTSDEFTKVVKDWIDTAKYPGTGKLYTEMVFQPMLELLAYLRNNGFKTYIVSGGSAEFMRPWVEKVYGIPPEQTIGTSIKMKFEMRNGKPVLVQIPEIFLADDNVGKPVGIYQFIGRRPIASFGNSDGDLQMMQWTMDGSGSRFALFVHHTDSVREYAYDRDSRFWLFDKALDEANAKGWTVVDMKNDWKVIYSYEKK